MKIQFEILDRRILFAGVTILTHGQSGNTSGWISSAADAIQARLGGTSAASEYSLTVDDVGNGPEVTELKLVSGNKPLEQTTAGEAIIKLDWSDISHGSVTTQTVAKLVADYLTVPHTGFPDFTQLPFHLIGHSRGGSLITALAGDLGQRGIWVDQVTNLDPHPVPPDVRMETHANVIFSDTYYQTDENTAIDPDGQPVDGSHNLNLEDSVGEQPGISAHNSVPAYYVGTIDFNATNDNDVKIFDSWYDDSPTKPPRDATGFAYSLIGGLTRPTDGVGQAFGGTAARSSPVKLSGTQWGNIINTRVEGTNKVGLDQPITLKSIYSDSDSADHITFFLDKDQNPLNGNAKALGTIKMNATSDPHSVTLGTEISGISTGVYYVASKIFDPDGHVRYSYGLSPIDVEVTNFASFSNGVVSVLGTSKSDNIDISGEGSGASSVLHATLNGFQQTLNTPNIFQVSIDGGAGDDTIIGQAGTPAMYAFGGDGNDSIQGGPANDTLSGGAGKNILYGNDGADRLNGSGGYDQLFGGGGDDRLYGNGGDDYLDGGGNVNRLFGGDGNDQLFGGNSNDKLYGENGNDTLSGRGGSDIEDGGAGTDTAQQDGTDILTSIETIA
jgi:Ca2+-binding RTX toxin-like protein